MPRIVRRPTNMAELLIYDDANRSRISVLLCPMTPDLRTAVETIQLEGRSYCVPQGLL